MTKTEAKKYLESLDILEGFIKDDDSNISSSLCFRLIKGIDAFRKEINQDTEDSDYYKIIPVAKRNVLVIKSKRLNYSIELIYQDKLFLSHFDSEQERDLSFQNLNDDKSLMEMFGLNLHQDWLKNLNEFFKLLFS